MHSVARRSDVPHDALDIAVQMGGDRELLFRLLCSPHGLAILAAGHAAHVNTTNLRLALMDRWMVFKDAQYLQNTGYVGHCDIQVEKCRCSCHSVPFVKN